MHRANIHLSQGVQTGCCITTQCENYRLGSGRVFYALLLLAIVPPVGVILLAVTATLAPVLLCTSIGFLIRWALLARRPGV